MMRNEKSVDIQGSLQMNVQKRDVAGMIALATLRGALEEEEKTFVTSETEVSFKIFKRQNQTNKIQHIFNCYEFLFKLSATNLESRFKLLEKVSTHYHHKILNCFLVKIRFRSKFNIS